MIALNLKHNQDDAYILFLLQVLPELIEFHESLLVCIGLGVKSDMEEVEFFYSLMFGKEVFMAGYVDSLPDTNLEPSE